ncbi:Protein of unknown function [Cotesia congregata]|uniref:Uncharacterized protein n=1 Tax=Cotesia congregata TaxID=51543 RepID=A0A8J2HHZ5_COTCN|nr:Protein of unknown function [Cotesia congregata]
MNYYSIRHLAQLHTTSLIKGRNTGATRWVGSVVSEISCRWDQLSMGSVDDGVSCQWDQLSMGSVVDGIS